MSEEIYLSVTDVNTYIKSVFDRDEFLSYVNIKGEISNLKFHSRGHLYFSLKDENSKINAVMFNYKKEGLAFTPKDGMNVEVKGKINVFVSGGSYQITVTSMKEDGVGNLFILFEELKKRLANEGLFDESRKKRLPRIPKKVGVITASTGAAVKDIISTINRRFPLTEIILFPTLVQGEGAKENIVRMLRKADESDVDVIILGRGGGSIEDLWAFNEEMVAREIAVTQKPVVSAVGHEIDYTISDFVSDLRAPTPTAAAELVVPSKLEILKYLSDYEARIISVIIKKLENYGEILKKYQNNYILKNPKALYQPQEQKLDNLLEKLNRSVLYKIEADRNKLNNIKARLELLNPKKQYLIEEQRINAFVNRLNNILSHTLEKKYSSLETIKIKLELLNPEKILEKGYSLTLIDGKIVKSKSDIKAGSIITTKLKDGIIISKTMEVK